MKRGLTQWIRDNTLLAAVLLGLAIWLGYKILVVIYLLLASIAEVLFVYLDASYGQLGGAFGYGVLGLGLGAAAGAVAAQRRFRLGRRIGLGAGLLVVVLLAVGYLGRIWLDYAARPEVTEPMDTNSEPMDISALPAVPAAEAPQPAAVAASPTQPDTAGLATNELCVATQRLALLADWRDSLSAGVAYWPAQDTVRLWRRAHGWGLVSPVAPAGQQPPFSGWVHLADLITVVAQTAEPLPTEADEPSTAATDSVIDL